MNQSKFIPILLFVFGFLLYANTLDHDYVLDDFSVIKENFVVKKGIEGIPTIWKTHYRYGYGYQQASLYRPLTLSLFAIQWELAPGNPKLAHWTNVLLYSCLGVLLYYFLSYLLKGNRLLAFLASLLFIAHPIHTEVVANIKSVDDILALGFSLSAVLLFLKSLEKPNNKLLIVSLLLYFLAFLSKESSVIFIFIIPLILLLFYQKSLLEVLKRTWFFILPFLAYLLLRTSVLGSLKDSNAVTAIDNLLVAAPSSIIRFATAIKILGLYAWKLVFPYTLMNDYSLNEIQLVGFKSWEAWLSLIVYALLVYAGIRFRKTRPILSFSIAFYLIAVSLYSNLFITIGTSFGERLLFMPSLGFCLLVAYLIQKPFKVQPSKKDFTKKAWAPLLLSLLLILPYSLKTIDRNKAWKDNFTLYETDVKNCSESARCQYYYGLGLMKEVGAVEKDPVKQKNHYINAINALNKAIQIYPNYSDAWSQRGLAYYRLKNYKEAEKSYLQATQYNPGNATAWSNLGSLYFDQKRYAEAKTAYEKAIRANPNHLDALANYASTLGTMGEFNAAINYFQRAIAINPNEASYYRMIGLTYQNLGNQQQANLYLKKANDLIRQAK